ncbi:MAG: late competence development ComFB family protein [Oscillospiraceae bacterium]|nr:late competence development ComFB family protein [Oscillospiraceae bacterium]
MPGRKTNKTAHVLNLLTNSPETTEEVTESAVNIPEEPPVIAKPEPQPEPEPKSNPVLESQKNMEKQSNLSELLRNELEKELDAEMREETNDKEKTVMDDKKTVSETSGDVLLGNTDDYISINIVEDIIKSRAVHFIEKLGGCTCARCVNDVVAYTLNSLPPKYTVSHKGMLFSKIATYENQYTSDISTAMTRAVITVMNSPRH